MSKMRFMVKMEIEKKWKIVAFLKLHETNASQLKVKDSKKTTSRCSDSVTEIV